jgi:transmembrane sensor
MRKVQYKLSPQILDEASEWFVDFSEGDVNAAGREAFNAWLRASPEHVRAYLQVSAFWEDAGALSKAAKLDADAMIAGALPDDNVFPLVPPMAGQGRRWRRNASPRRVFIAASFFIALCLTAALVWWQTQRAPVYITATGEQRSIVLTDGSTVELNSRSRIEIHFADRERRVDLLGGQALFTVAKDATRPFLVRSGEATVRAVGTQFDVYRKKSATIVTVLEGRVAIAKGRSEGLSLAAGEQLTIAPRREPRPVRANIAAATAWTQRQLVFDSTPLADIAEEFNRYNSRRLVIEGAALERFHVSGVFSSTDPQRFVRFMRERFGILVEETDEEIRIFPQK